MKNIKNKFLYEGRDLEAMDFAVKYHKWILDIFKIHLGAKIVEVGAGSGSFTQLLFTLKPKKIIAIEPSEEMFPLLLKINKQNLITHKDFFSGVAKAIKKEKPNSIIYINVFEHIKDDELELRTLFDTMPRGGKLCIFVPANTWLYSNFDKKIGHFRRYTKSELYEKVQDAGFNVVLLKRFDLFGVVPWFIKFCLFKSESMEPGLTKFYDTFVVPIERTIEKRVSPPFGKNLILVAEKP